MEIQTGQADVVVAGGAENISSFRIMSRMRAGGQEWGIRRLRTE